MGKYRFKYKACWLRTDDERDCREGVYETDSEAGQIHIEADIRILLTQPGQMAEGLNPREIEVRIID